MTQRLREYYLPPAPLRVQVAGAVLLAIAVVSAWVGMYVPARERNAATQLRVSTMHQELNQQQAQLHRLRMRRDRLRVVEPEAVEQAIREELRWGRSGEMLAPGAEAPWTAPISGAVPDGE